MIVIGLKYSSLVRFANGWILMVFTIGLLDEELDETVKLLDEDAMRLFDEDVARLDDEDVPLDDMLIVLDDAAVEMLDAADTVLLV